MTWIEACGYLASSLVLLTFCMHTMLTLRAVAICSNIAFILYGIGAGLHPVLILHMVLHPLNAAHLGRMLLGMRRTVEGDTRQLRVQPFSETRWIKAGEASTK